MGDKVVSLRIFADQAGKMKPVGPGGGRAILVVSQFTLYGDARKDGGPASTAPRRRKRRVASSENSLTGFALLAL